MNWLTIVLFFIYLWGFGFTATFFIKKSEQKGIELFFEQNIMRLGIGLSVFILFGVILNLFNLPLDWKIFLLASLIIPIIFMVKNGNLIKKRLFEISQKIKEIKITKSEIYILIILVLFTFTFYMYHQGAFAYQYLEDDDPWEHARDIKYISQTKTVSEPYSGQDLFKYFDPYPPGYELLMAILYQTNDSINWTLKFFNVLIISLSIFMFYFFATKFLKSRKKALFAALILTLIPSYLSHFIWVHSLIPLLFFTAFYCLEKLGNYDEEQTNGEQVDDIANQNKRWFYPASLVIAGIFLVHPEGAIKFVLFFGIYFILKVIFEKKISWPQLYSLFFGGLLSLIWWATKVSSFFGERLSRISYLDPNLISPNVSFGYKIIGFFKNYFSSDLGSATRAYTFNDFFIAKDANMINNPIGWGIAITLLTIISIIIIIVMLKKYYTHKIYSLPVALGWFILTFLIVNSATFKIPGLFGFRTWMLLAIPVSLICAEGYFSLSNFVPKSLKLGRIIFLLLIILGLWFTAGSQKYTVNTVPWPPGVSWTSMEEVQLYLWVNNLPKETKVMHFSGVQDNHLIGLDMSNCDWSKEYLDFRKDFINKTPILVYAFLKQNSYQYLILDSMSFKTYEGMLGNETQKIVLKKFQEYLKFSDKFSIAYQNNGGIILKIN